MEARVSMFGRSLLLVAGFALAAAGCRDASRTHRTAAEIAKNGVNGPDAVTGQGNTKIVAKTSTNTTNPETVPDNDFLLSSDVLDIGIEAVGMEFDPEITPPMFLDPDQPGLPINMYAPSGGNLVDIQFHGKKNDQFLFAAQVVGGFSNVTNGFPTDPLNTPVFNFEVLVPGTEEYRAFLDDNPEIIPVAENRGSTVHLIVRGVIASVNASLPSFEGTEVVEAGVVMDSLIGPLLPPAFHVNVPRLGNIVVEEESGIPIFVTTIYALPVNSRIFSILTIVSDPTPGSPNRIGIGNIIDVILTGGNGARNLDTLSGNPMFFPIGVVNPSLGLWRQPELVPSDLLALLSPTGFAEDLPQIGTAPYVTFIGRDEPGVSYTFFDPNRGALVVDERVRQATALAQLRSERDLDDASTPERETSFAHLRMVSVGDRNDAASSLDGALVALGNQGKSLSDSGRATPNTMLESVVLTGRIDNAPEGTIVTISEVKPTFFSFFNPNSDSPTPSVIPFPAHPGFFGPQPGIPPVVNGVNATVVNEVLRTTVRPEPTGGWQARVPVGADVLFVPPGLEQTVAESVYVVRYFVPGAEEPIELLPKRIRRGGPEVIHFGVTDAKEANLATIEFEILDGTAGRIGQVIPGKITVLPEAPGPVFFDLGEPTGIADPLERAKGAGLVIHSATGRGKFRVPAGFSYRLIASAGNEWEPDEAEILSVAPGRNPPVTFELVQKVDPTNRITLDGHVHSSASFDSSCPLEDRVRTFLAAHVQVLCVTDHDVIADLEPALNKVEKEQPRLRDMLHGIHGSEVTSTVPGYSIHPFGIGHFTAFPLPFKENVRKKNSIEDEFRPVTSVIQQIRRLEPGEEIVNLAHPREPSTSGIPGLFNAFGYFENLEQSRFQQPLAGIDFTDFNDGAVRALLNGDSIAGLPSPPFPPQLPALAPFIAGSLDFDTIEGLTGNSEEAAERFVEIRRDWFDLLNRGIVKTMMWNTDTHRLDERRAETVVGFPRNYLLIEGATPRTITDQECVAALKPFFPNPADIDDPLPYSGARPGSGKVFCTTGPVFASLTVNSSTGSGTIGDVVTGSTNNTFTVSVVLEGPDFVLSEVDSALVWVNGFLVDGAVESLSDGPGANRKSLTVSFDADNFADGTDAWLVVEVGRALRSDDNFAPHAAGGELYRIVAAGGVVHAVSNPVFLEIDGDAANWTPPGNDFSYGEDEDTL